MLARKAMEQAQRLREEKAAERDRLKKDKQFTWNQKVRSRRGDAAGPGLASQPACIEQGGVRPGARRDPPSAVPLLQEKRKREQGKATRGGSYVEEEKRRAREFGVFSGFD